MSLIWSGASELLLKLLAYFYSMTNSYGLAIVLFTILVRIALYPLNKRQMKNIQRMQKIKLRLNEIQEEYADFDDKEKLNEEMMGQMRRLYKENNISLSAGCMPLLVQIPILILLFNVLRTYDFAGATFFGVTLGASTLAGLGQAVGAAADAQGVAGLMTVLLAVAENPSGLAAVDLYLPNLLLLIGIAVLTWAQLKVSGAGIKSRMDAMDMIMPLFMAFIFLSMPGGVMLYWGLALLIGVLQQYRAVKNAKNEISVNSAL